MRIKVFLHLENIRRFVGVFASNEGRIAFEFSPEFLKTGLEISPLAVPLQRGAQTFQSAPFGGLPGFAADSLPDGWGNLLLDRRLARSGERLATVDPLRRLCWVGKNGMGALEYEPEEVFASEVEAGEIALDTLADNADKILADNDPGNALDALASLNGSSGGARPKIVCLVSNDLTKLSRGSMPTEAAYPWLIKFRNSSEGKDCGLIEYAVSLLAKRAGIEIPETNLFASKHGPGWFGVKRFDLTAKGKLHMATAAGLLHCDFHEPCLDYASLMELTRRLAGATALGQLLKRAYFNFVIDNRDDHAKNFSYLMDGSGKWSLAPAYDLTPATGGFEHMTALLGCGKAPERRLFLKLADEALMPKKAAAEALEEVDEALAAWPSIARSCGIDRPQAFNPIR